MVSTSSDEGLCNICAGIDLGEFFRPSDPSQLQEIPLGLWRDVQQRTQCKLCRLVAKAVSHSSLVNEVVTLKRYLFATTEEIHPDQWRRIRKRNNWLPIPLIPNANPLTTAYTIGVYLKEAKSHRSDLVLAEASARKLSLPRIYQGRSVNLARADMQLAAEWLRICIKQHGKLCASPGSDLDPNKLNRERPLENIIMIDVHEMRLCSIHGPCEYITLSYRWPSKTFLLRRNAGSNLFEVGSLTKVKKNMPMVFQDAIDAVKELGHRYLWIDALCIFQDDDAHKAHQIAQMDRVYGGSMMTMIAASGPEASDDTGLQGFRCRHPSFQQNSEEIRDLIVYSSIPDSRSGSPWAKRAWTFQEERLSRRKLYFTKTQLFFECSSCIFTEDRAMERSPPSAYTSPDVCSLYSRYVPVYGFNFKGIPGTSSNHTDTVVEYMKIVRQYCQRKMTYPEDVILAFEGLLAVFSRALDTEMFAGLPVKYLDQCLLWMNNWSYYKRAAPSTSRIPYGSFPTWSWVAWQGGRTYHVALGRSVLSELAWFIMDKNDTMYRVQTMSTAPTDPRGHCSLLPEPCPEKILSGACAVLPSKEVAHSDYAWNHSHFLSCWTAVAEFRISGQKFEYPEMPSRFGGFSNLVIEGDLQRAGGSIWMHDSWIRKNVQKPKTLEFMLLSRSEVATTLPEKVLFFDCEAYPERPWCYVNVMLIERKGDRAERLGVGTVHEDAWLGANSKAMLLKLL